MGWDHNLNCMLLQFIVFLIFWANEYIPEVFDLIGLVSKVASAKPKHITTCSLWNVTPHLYELWP